ncbi:hypothetical protein HDU98_002797, partial [Podochytrium sp. JEL0797]
MEVKSMPLPRSDGILVGQPRDTADASEWLASLTPAARLIFASNTALFPAVLSQNSIVTTKPPSLAPAAKLQRLPNNYKLLRPPAGQSGEIALFGHPSGAVFRTPSEFAPHLEFLLLRVIHPHTKCACSLCSSTARRSATPPPNQPKAVNPTAPIATPAIKATITLPRRSSPLVNSLPVSNSTPTPVLPLGSCEPLSTPTNTSHATPLDPMQTTIKKEPLPRSSSVPTEHVATPPQLPTARSSTPPSKPIPAIPQPSSAYRASSPLNPLSNPAVSAATASPPVGFRASSPLNPTANLARRSESPASSLGTPPVPVSGSSVGAAVNSHPTGQDGTVARMLKLKADREERRRKSLMNGGGGGSAESSTTSSAASPKIPEAAVAAAAASEIPPTLIDSAALPLFPTETSNSRRSSVDLMEVPKSGALQSFFDDDSMDVDSGEGADSAGMSPLSPVLETARFGGFVSGEVAHKSGSEDDDAPIAVNRQRAASVKMEGVKPDVASASLTPASAPQQQHQPSTAASILSNEATRSPSPLTSSAAASTPVQNMSPILSSSTFPPAPPRARAASPLASYTLPTPTPNTARAASPLSTSTVPPVPAPEQASSPLTSAPARVESLPVAAAAAAAARAGSPLATATPRAKPVFKNKASISARLKNLKIPIATPATAAATAAASTANVQVPKLADVAAKAAVGASLAMPAAVSASTPQQLQTGVAPTTSVDPAPQPSSNTPFILQLGVEEGIAAQLLEGFAATISATSSSTARGVPSGSIGGALKRGADAPSTAAPEPKKLHLHQQHARIPQPRRNSQSSNTSTATGASSKIAFTPTPAEFSTPSRTGSAPLSSAPPQRGIPLPSSLPHTISKGNVFTPAARLASAPVSHTPPPPPAKKTAVADTSGSTHHPKPTQSKRRASLESASPPPPTTAHLDATFTARIQSQAVLLAQQWVLKYPSSMLQRGGAPLTLVDVEELFGKKINRKTVDPQQFVGFVNAELERLTGGGGSSRDSGVGGTKGKEASNRSEIPEPEGSPQKRLKLQEYVQRATSHEEDRPIDLPQPHYLPLEKLPSSPGSDSGSPFASQPAIGMSSQMQADLILKLGSSSS